MSKTYQVWTREGHQELTQGEWWDFDRSLLHRTDGPAWIYPDGTKLWYQNGQRHRVDGPALIYPDGTKLWYHNDQRHRVDGPAWVFPDGTKLWFLNDQELPKNEVELWIKSNNIDLNCLEDQLMFITEWGIRMSEKVTCNK